MTKSLTSIVPGLLLTSLFAVNITDLAEASDNAADSFLKARQTLKEARCLSN